MASVHLAYVMTVYSGSDAHATKGLYARLVKVGPVGTIAVNLLRAQKSSERAKVYRGRSYRGLAYDKKQWSMDQLTTALTEHGEALGIGWGWGEDPKQEFHRWVLYVELPNGQVSFHTAERGAGPDAPRPWDGVLRASPQRICSWAAQLLEG